MLPKRHAINQATRNAHPARWSGRTYNWTPIGTNSVNQERNMTITTPESEKSVVNAL